MERLQKERKAKGKERLVVKCVCVRPCVCVCVIQSKPPAAPLILSMLGCCENG